MVGISSSIYKECREIFLLCDQFDDDDRLGSVFVVDILWALRDGLPQASNKKERVDKCLAYLIEQSSICDESILAVFIKTLRDSTADETLLRKKLADLYQKVRDYAFREEFSVGSPVFLSSLREYIRTVWKNFKFIETRSFIPISRISQPDSLYFLDDANTKGIYEPARFDLQLSRIYEEDLQLDDSEMVFREPGEILKDIDLDALLSYSGNFVIVGRAGSGKSTLLKRLALLFAQDFVSDTFETHQYFSREIFVPIYISLGEFDLRCSKEPKKYERNPKGFLMFVEDSFTDWYPEKIAVGFLGDLIKNGKACLLLDGLDEVINYKHRGEVRDIIESLAKHYSGNKIFVTIRDTAYNRSVSMFRSGFHKAIIRNFKQEQWESLIHRLYIGLGGNTKSAREQANRLIKKVKENPKLISLITTPLVVWILSFLGYAKQDLPNQRYQLYKAYVDLLLTERLKEEENIYFLNNDKWSLQDKELYLTYIGFRIHCENEKRREEGDASLISIHREELILDMLAPFIRDVKGVDKSQAECEARRFIDFILERSGLLFLQEENVSFGSHLVIQEFLSASYLANHLRNTAKDWKDFVENNVGKEWWREVLLFVAGCLSNRPGQFEKYLLGEIANLQEKKETYAYGVSWAGLALIEVSEKDKGVYSQVQNQIKKRLLDVVDIKEISIAARVEAGDILGSLGDDRFSGELLLPEFVCINPGSKNESKLYFAKYPTTNSMYSKFVDSGGYSQGEWWVEAEADGVWKSEGTIIDSNYPATKHRKLPFYWDHHQFNKPNQPVIGITWYEALAYCRWLTQMLIREHELERGHEIRLPSIAEWEYAASGSDRERLYPWGDVWHDDCANTREINVERTTPVGIFPKGATPEGILDLAGNVWEWCLDSHLSPNLKSAKGGSWKSDYYNTQCSFSTGFIKHGWAQYTLGFRIIKAKRVG